jgi:hypothetical protein
VSGDIEVKVSSGLEICYSHQNMGFSDSTQDIAQYKIFKESRNHHEHCFHNLKASSGGRHSRTAIKFYEIHTPLTEAGLPDSRNYKTIVSLC